MKLIIAGGRNYDLTEQDFARLDKLLAEAGVTEVVSGKCVTYDKDGKPHGADYWGEQWAARHGIPVKPFPAAWKYYGTAAGPIRNKAMAEYADALAAFPGGKGTSNMVKLAILNDLRVFDFRKTPRAANWEECNGFALDHRGREAKNDVSQGG